MNKEKIKKIAKKTALFLFNPRLLLCFGIGWIITNGWAYIFLAIGTLLKIKWMIYVSGAYMSFLWFPFTPEKIVTVIIAIALLKFLFPKDEKTLAVLLQMKEKIMQKKKPSPKK